MDPAPRSSFGRNTQSILSCASRSGSKGLANQLVTNHKEKKQDRRFHWSCRLHPVVQVMNNMGAPEISIVHVLPPRNVDMFKPSPIQVRSHVAWYQLRVPSLLQVVVPHSLVVASPQCKIWVHLSVLMASKNNRVNLNQWVPINAQPKMIH